MNLKFNYIKLIEQNFHLQQYVHKIVFNALCDYIFKKW